MSRHHLAFKLLVSSLGLLSSGCINTDPTVFVEGTISEATGTVESSTLSTGFSGSFQVNFHLGPRAADQSEVSLGSLSVANASQTATIVPVLEVTSSPTFPVTVLIDGDTVVDFSFAAEDNLLDTETEADLCAPEGIRIVGAFEGSLRGATITPASEPFTVSGCP